MNKKTVFFLVTMLAVPSFGYGRRHHHGHGGDIAVGVGLGAIGVGLLANAVSSGGESESSMRCKDNDGYKFWEIHNDTPYTMHIKGLSKRKGTIAAGECGKAEHKKTWTLVVSLTTPQGPVTQRFTPHEHRYNHSLSFYLEKDGTLALKSW